MYYVSRKDSRRRHCIMDTDDWVEECIPEDDVIKLLQSGVEILGATLICDDKFKRIYVEYTIYSLPTAKRANWMLMYGLDVNVTPSGCITSISILASFRGNRIVLGDFGTSVSTDITDSEVKGIIFVFDDRIKSVDSNWCSYRTKVDLSNFNNHKILMSLYKSQLYSYDKVFDYRNSIIDTPDKYLRYSSLSFISLNCFMGGFYHDIKKLGLNSSFPDEFVLPIIKKSIMRSLSRLVPDHILIVETGWKRYYSGVFDKLMHPTDDTYFTEKEIVKCADILPQFNIGVVLRAFIYVTAGGKDPDILSITSKLAIVMWDRLVQRR